MFALRNVAVSYRRDNYRLHTHTHTHPGMFQLFLSTQSVHVYTPALPHFPPVCTVHGYRLKDNPLTISLALFKRRNTATHKTHRLNKRKLVPSCSNTGKVNEGESRGRYRSDRFTGPACSVKHVPQLFSSTTPWRSISYVVKPARATIATIARRGLLSGAGVVIVITAARSDARAGWR